VPSSRSEVGTRRTIASGKAGSAIPSAAGNAAAGIISLGPDAVGNTIPGNQVTETTCED
jgi:hypothetical protein